MICDISKSLRDIFKSLHDISKSLHDTAYARFFNLLFGG